MVCFVVTENSPGKNKGGRMRLVNRAARTRRPGKRETTVAPKDQSQTATVIDINERVRKTAPS